MLYLQLTTSYKHQAEIDVRTHSLTVSTQKRRDMPKIRLGSSDDEPVYRDGKLV